MKLRALGNLSGAVGEQPKGTEFEVDDDIGQGLVDRGIAERVSDKPTVAGKSEKAVKE